MVGSHWRKLRGLDPDTMASMVGIYTAVLSAGLILNRTLIDFVLSSVGFDVTWVSWLVSISGMILSAGLLQRKSYRLKRWTLMGCVIFWTFVLTSFILSGPTQPLYATFSAFSSLLCSIITYWRSWVWVK